MSNVTVSYMYRDGNNFKQTAEVVVDNPDNLDLNQAEAQILKTLDEQRYFIAHQLDLPDAFFWTNTNHPFDPEADHSWHEFTGLTPTDDEPTDERTLSQLIAAFHKASTDGWAEFDPAEA